MAYKKTYKKKYTPKDNSGFQKKEYTPKPTSGNNAAFEAMLKARPSFPIAILDADSVRAATIQEALGEGVIFPNYTVFNDNLLNNVYKTYLLSFPDNIGNIGNRPEYVYFKFGFIPMLYTSDKPVKIFIYESPWDEEVKRQVEYMAEKLEGSKIFWYPTKETMIEALKETSNV